MSWSLITSLAAFGGSTPVGPLNTTGADLIVIMGFSLSLATPTDNQSNTYTAAKTSTVSGRGECGIYYTHNPTTNASHTFTFNVNFASILVLVFSGSASGSIVDQTNSNNMAGDGVTTTFQTGSITPTQSSELIVAGWGLDDPPDTGGTPFSVDSGFTLGPVKDVVSGAFFGGVSAYLFQNSAAAVNPTMTRSNAMSGGGDGADACIVSFKGAGGVAGGVTPIPLVMYQASRGFLPF
jgi:hypothetical protein